MPTANTTAGVPSNCSTSSGQPTAAVITGNAANALPMMIVKTAMPMQYSATAAISEPFGIR